MRYMLRNMLDDRKFIYQGYLINYVDYKSHTASLAQLVELCEYVDENRPYDKHVLRSIVKRKREKKLRMYTDCQYQEYTLRLMASILKKGRRI